MKNESKFYNEIKKNINQISWIRIENNSLFGTPDLLGYNNNCTFFTVELKVARGTRLRFHLIKLPFILNIRKILSSVLRGKVQDP